MIQKLTAKEKVLLESIFRYRIADLQGEQYRGEKLTGKVFPAYEREIADIRNIQKKLLRG